MCFVIIVLYRMLYIIVSTFYLFESSHLAVHLQTFKCDEILFLPSDNKFDILKTTLNPKLITNLSFCIVPGLVPERPSQMAAYGAEAGGQIRQMRRCGWIRSRRRYG